MELLDQIIYGVRSGKYWFISVAMLFYIASVFLLLVIENKEYKTSDDQVKAMNFAVRMILASLTVLVVSNLFAVLSGTGLKIALVVIGAIVILMMINVDKLPIWDETGE